MTASPPGVGKPEPLSMWASNDARLFGRLFPKMLLKNITHGLRCGARCSPQQPGMGRWHWKSPSPSRKRRETPSFGPTSLDLARVAPLGTPTTALKVTSSTGYSLEMKPEVCVACQVTMAALFIALLVTATAFAGEHRGFHLVGNSSERRGVVAHVSDPPLCSQGRRHPTQEAVLSKRGTFQ